MKEINIIEILKDKPKGIKLWSPIVGGCTFKGISSENGVIVASFIDKEGDILEWDFGKDGRTLSAPKEAEVCLFPSKKMRDWEKFAWKKGDVLTDDERFVVFKGFDTDDYTEFSASFEYEDGAYRRDLWFVTNDFRKVSYSVAQEVIKNIEGYYGGKLNLETLKFEKPKKKFKNGDIVFIKGETKDGNAIAIIKEPKNGIISNSACWAILFYARNELRIADGVNGFVAGPADDNDVRKANRSEAIKLLKAINVEGMRWNADKNVIEALPKKFEFYPYQRVLVRQMDGYCWQPTLFGYYDDKLKRYVCVNAATYTQCIPYTEKTKHLIGTTTNFQND